MNYDGSNISKNNYNNYSYKTNINKRRKCVAV